MMDEYEYFEGFLIALGDAVKCAYLAKAYQDISPDELLNAIDDMRDAVERITDDD